MKKYLLVLFIFLGVKSADACHCQPYTQDFYKNITKFSTVAMLYIDSVWKVQDSNMHTTPYGRLIVLKPYSAGLNSGDTLILEGQDGVNCNWGYDSTQVGDSILAIVEPGAIAWWGQYHCGTPAITIKNGMSGGLTMSEIEAKINRYITSVEKVDEIEIITLNPNPANAAVVIDLPPSGNYDLLVTSILGRAELSMNDVSGRTELDVSGLESGMYVVTISNSKRQQTIRFVKE